VSGLGWQRSRDPDAGGAAVEIDDIDADRRGQTGRVAVLSDLSDEVVHWHFTAARDVAQRIPHYRLKAHTGAVTRHNDVADR
jgi:hypothetical protein